MVGLEKFYKIGKCLKRVCLILNCRWMGSQVERTKTLEDKGREGRPETAISDENWETANNMVLENCLLKLFEKMRVWGMSEKYYGTFQMMKALWKTGVAFVHFCSKDKMRFNFLAFIWTVLGRNQTISLANLLLEVNQGYIPSWLKPNSGRNSKKKLMALHR